MTEAITGIEAALDAELARFCGECGAELAPRGSQCAACGELPPETREEARERLMAEPDAVARAESARLRGEAGEMLAAVVRMLRDADAVEHRSVLRKARDAAQVRLDAATAGLEGAATVLEAATRAEAAAAGPLADAFGVHREAVKAEEEARRLRKGAAAEVDAQVRLEKAAGILARYRDGARAAVQAREDAEEAVRAVELAISERERERDEAQAVLARCAPVPLSGETVKVLGRPLLAMAWGQDAGGGQLSVSERAMLGVVGTAIEGAGFAEFAGARGHAEEERIRAQLREEFQRAPHLRNLGPGRLEASWRKAPVPDGSTPAGGRVTPPPNLAPAPLGRPAPGVLPGLG